MDQQKLARELLGYDNVVAAADNDTPSPLDTRNLVSWNGIHVDWFQRCFMQLPEVQRLVEFGCRMWFIRNICIAMMLRAKDIHSGSIVQHLAKFIPPNREDDTEKPECNKATAFVSYTGAYTLKHFAELVGQPSLTGCYAWIDAFCVDQFAWTERDDKEMRDFKGTFMDQLGEKIQHVEYTTLMLDQWDNLMVVLGQIWVLWEIFCTVRDRTSKLRVLLSQKEHERFIDDGLGSVEGFDSISKSLAAIDAEGARAFNAEDRLMILGLMNTSDGVFNVNTRVVAEMRQWVLRTGKAQYDSEVKAGSSALWLGHSLASLYSDMGKKSEAETLFMKSSHGFQELLGEKHRTTLSAISNLGIVKLSQAQYTEAEKLQHQALRGRREAFGENDADTLESFLILAHLHESLGNYKVAEEHCVVSLQGRRALLGNVHIDTLRSLETLADLKRHQGHYGEAGSLYSEVLALYRKQLGRKHRKPLHTLRKRAYILKKQGDFQTAQELYRESMVGCLEQLGGGHHQTTSTHNDVGVILMELGNYSDSDKLLRLAVTGRRQIQGDLHPDTLTSVANLATLCQMQSKYHEAEIFHKEALNGRRETLGEDHPDTLSSTNDLGVLFITTGRLKEAEPLLQGSIIRRRRTLGPKHPDTLTTINNLAAVFHRTGKYDDAEPLYREALEGRLDRLGELNPDTLSSAGNLAALYHQQGKSSEAEPLYRKYCRVAVKNWATSTHKP